MLMKNGLCKWRKNEIPKNPRTKVKNGAAGENFTAIRRNMARMLVTALMTCLGLNAVEANGAQIQVGAVQVVVAARGENLVEVDLQPNGVAGKDTAAMAPQTWPEVDAKIETTGTSVNVKTGRIQVTVLASPSSIVLTDGTGKTLCRLGWNGDDVTDLRFEPAQAALFHGTGLDVQAGSQGTAGGPFAWTTGGYGLVWDADGGTFEPGKPGSPGKLRIGGRPDAKLFLCTGTPKELMGAETSVSGTAPLFPKYINGFMVSRWGINEKELLEGVNTFRAKQIPFDMYIVDYDWFQYGKDDFAWNTDNFPDGPSGKLCKELLAARGVKLTTIRKPRLEGGSKERPEAIEKGFMYMNREQSGALTPSIEFNYSTPERRAWWRNHSLPIFDNGVVGYWNDEADNHGNFHFMEMERSYYEGQRAHADQRVWSINRNFYLGSQRYAYALWSGDIQTGFQSMADQRARMLSAIEVGCPWWSMDTGGFNGHPNEENYARWVEFGAFVPVFRAHGTHDEKREPWNYGPKAEAAATDAIRLRYRLLPYIYSSARETTQTGVSIVRPLIYEWPQDPHAERTDEWMFGSGLLVRPVVEEGAKSVKVYLPAGEWVDWWTGKKFTGPAEIDRDVDAETWKDIPLYVRRGAIIPTAAPMNWVGEKAIDPVKVEIYPDKEPSSFTYYDDDGVTYGYEKGAFYAVSLECKREGGKIVFTLGSPNGSFAPPHHNWELRFHMLETQPGAVMVNGQAAQAKIEQAQDGKVVTVTMPAGNAGRVEIGVE